MRLCGGKNGCGVEKDESDFGTSCNICKPCTKKYRRAKYAEKHKKEKKIEDKAFDTSLLEKYWRMNNAR